MQGLQPTLSVMAETCSRSVSQQDPLQAQTLETIPGTIDLFWVGSHLQTSGAQRREVRSSK